MKIINCYQGETRGDDTQHDYQRAGASSALLPLLAGKTSILLVTDKNVGALEATRAIHRLLAAEGRVVEVIDTVPAEPSHHDVAQIVSQLDASQPQLVVGIGGEACWM